MFVKNMLKFCYLQGDLSHNDPGDYLTSIFAQYHILPITQRIAYLPTQWVQSDITILDYRHYLYDDHIFCEYLDKVKKCPVIRFADLPFHYENFTDPEQQLENLIHRTKIACDILKDSILISPSIGAFSEEISHLYMRYFKQCSHYFQKFAIDCSIETDREIAILSGLLNQILSHCPRDVWVTKWCFPAFDSEVYAKIGERIKLFTTKAAESRLKHIFRSINAISENTTWHIANAGRDHYNPGKSPNDFIWAWPYGNRKVWTKQNFMGLLSWNGIPKIHMTEALAAIFNEFV